MRFRICLLGVMVLAAVCGLCGCATNIYPLYLTWQGDPSTTMTVTYHTPLAPDEPMVFYDTVAHEGDVSAYRYRTTGTSWELPGLPDERHINSVELTALEPNALYYFVAGDGNNGFCGEKKFRTVPQGGEPFRFVSGGDMSVLPREKLLLKRAARENPLFAVIGGDIAYANGDLDNFYLWDLWLKRWTTIMITDEGALIPMVLAIGNHEVNELEGPDEARAPFYLSYFPQGGKSYFARRFGANLSLVVLDSGHLTPHEAQQAWLGETLAAQAEVPVKMAVYHVPMYPSVRDFDGDLSEAGRQYWLPLFDQYSLTTAFENHDHAFKRSKLLRAGQLDPNGTLYLGDGCFGVKAREVAKPMPWYLEKSSRTPHFWVVEMQADTVHYRAVDSWGGTVDELTQAMPVAAAVR